MICVNPIVPVDTLQRAGRRDAPRSRLTDLGLPTVLSQTFRTLIHSRMTVGMSAYAERFPNQRPGAVRAAARRLPDVLHEHLQLRARARSCASTPTGRRDATCCVGTTNWRRSSRKHGIRLRGTCWTTRRCDLWRGVGLAGGVRPRQRRGHRRTRSTQALARGSTLADGARARWPPRAGAPARRSGARRSPRAVARPRAGRRHGGRHHAGRPHRHTSARCRKRRRRCLSGCGRTSRGSTPSRATRWPRPATARRPAPPPATISASFRTLPRP